MKTELGSLPAVCPMPVLIVSAYDKDGTVSIMNAAWGTISQMDKIVLMIDEDHKTTQSILGTKAFTVSLANRKNIVPADYVGIVSGNKVPDKFSRSGLHAYRSKHVNAPVVEEFPITMECELAEVLKTETMYAIVGRIVNVLADEDIVGENGKIDIGKADLLLFDQFSWSYNTIGEVAGKAGQAGKALKRSV
ncbi:MAG: flavin reductase [Candidatus Methanomethylophilaceae archaeon]|nr:flavin reductase [Candidatus Methanomethylophilaceae archaeon]